MKAKLKAASQEEKTSKEESIFLESALKTS